MRYGTIGTSWITETFIAGSRLVDGMEPYAVYSRDLAKGEAFAKKNNVEVVFTDISAMAACPSVDAVYIASPNSLHYEQSRLFLENGKHVICEKPACSKPQELAGLHALAHEKNLVFLEAIKMMHLPQRALLREAVKKIGPVSGAHFKFCQLSSKLGDYLEGKNPNIFNPEFATGCLMDLGVYCVYPALDLFGEPRKILSSASMLASGADAAGNSIFIYDDKQVALSYSKIGQGYGCSEIIGQAGTLTIQSISNLSEIILKKNEGTEEKIWGSDSKDVSMSYEAKNFLAYINNPCKYEEEYRYASRLSLNVARVLEEIRTCAILSYSGY